MIGNRMKSYPLPLYFAVWMYNEWRQIIHYGADHVTYTQGSLITLTKTQTKTDTKGDHPRWHHAALSWHLCSLETPVSFLQPSCRER
ncbi:hypothetical protein TNIN_268521 [Trichonephila inaurata madagascariensis]|uniref:Uncharacterized protein n=1 Tax=Trichonephila inaurata madagascariensis TaxID=2747483 RepID=A0A8X7CQD7_9ARAC|nr:hypothetical protein TNIN_268521 [Trichonephila inaurata madagascariensis]